MKQFINEASWDRIVRVLLGLVLLYVGFGGVVAGGWGIAIGILGLVPLLTGLFGICPLYAIFKLHTN
jgi:Inner membrane protein YgaP-like, transmembrane domain